VTSGSLVDQFRSADASVLPDLSSLDDRHKAFWVLELSRDIGLDVMSPAEIEEILRDAFGYHVPRQRIESILSAEKGTVARRKRDKRRVYQLMAPGAEELQGAKSAVVFIEPLRGFSGLRETHAMLAEMAGEVRVCDPYVDLKTLDMLAECANANDIRLLTHNVKSKAGFKQAVKTFATEHGKGLDVAVAPPKVLHDRYAIHDDGMLVFGTSLNGLGAKQSFVIAMGEDIRATVLGAFETTWQNASPL
jgi:hypothetical protein